MGGSYFCFPSSLSSKDPYLALACLFISVGVPVADLCFLSGGKELVMQLEGFGSVPESDGLL